MTSQLIPRKSNRLPRKSQAGFTLLELMIAALVMVVGLTGGLLLVMTAMANNNRNRMDSSGTVLAQTTLEMIASVPPDSAIERNRDGLQSHHFVRHPHDQYHVRQRHRSRSAAHQPQERLISRRPR